MKTKQTIYHTYLASSSTSSTTTTAPLVAAITLARSLAIYDQTTTTTTITTITTVRSGTEG